MNRLIRWVTTDFDASEPSDTGLASFLAWTIIVFSIVLAIAVVSVW